MLNLLIELLTRLVVAMETIAENAAAPCAVASATAVKPQPETNTRIDPAYIPRDYEAYLTQKDGLKVLKELCEKRGIEVPKGTKGATLVANLRKQDAVLGTPKMSDMGENASPIKEGVNDQAPVQTGVEILTDDFLPGLDLSATDLPDPFDALAGPVKKNFTDTEVSKTLQQWVKNRIETLLPSLNGDQGATRQQVSAELQGLLATYKSPAGTPATKITELSQDDRNHVMEKPAFLALFNSMVGGSL